MKMGMVKEKERKWVERRRVGMNEGKRKVKEGKEREVEEGVK